MSIETSINGDKQVENISTNNNKGIINWLKGHQISTIRRFVLLAVIVFFMLQFLRVKIAVGSLSGSLALWFVKLIDVFAYLESLVASMDFTTTALIAVLPILAVYLVFGRAFCGWLCPMDYIFTLADRIRKWRVFNFRISPKAGYIVVIGFLGASFALGMPVFTNYFSHLTNFFRGITGAYFYVMDMPAELDVVIYSFAVIAALFILELLFPRMWCRLLCPVGRVYGLFNKVSRLRLKLNENQCLGCKACDSVCYMGVKVSEYVGKSEIRDINCIYCGRCVESCNKTSKLIKMNLSLK
ncbi:MAG: 4Fe-4S binding protein [Nitrospiraceae bacterium]|nr:4Fe-4S binding protein [Nitrospiraceae bacterium]